MQTSKIMINYKNFFYSLIIFLPLNFSNANAGYGFGELKISDNVLYDFQRYIQQWQPMRFLVTNDGQNSTWWYCPEAQCKAGGDTVEAKKCAITYGVQCQTFAVRRTIKWRNGIDARSLKIKFTSKDSIQDLKDKFTRLNLYEGGNEGSVEPSKKSSISKRLESLTSLYEKGLLTETEFKKAKEKLLK